MPAKNIVIVGGGIVGTCAAYYLATNPARDAETTITLVEAVEVASAASGKA